MAVNKQVIFMIERPLVRFYSGVQPNKKEKKKHGIATNEAE